MAGPTVAVRPGVVASAPPQAAAVRPMSAPVPTSDTRSMALLEKIKGRKMGEGRNMPAIIILEGNKGIKTIAALAVRLAAGKSMKGTPILDTPGLPIPAGLVSVISFDHQTEASLQSYYGTTQAAVNEVETIPIRQLLGFNAGQPKTANDVVDGLRALLGSWASEKRAMIVMDRWDELTENIIKLVCYHRAGLPADASLVDRGVWNPRKSLIFEVIDLLIAATMEGGVIILTGSEDKDEGAEKVTVVNGKTVIAQVPSKWAARVEMHANAHIVGTVGDTTSGQRVRVATSRYSRYPPIPEGVRIRLDGRNIGAFQDPSSHIDIEHKDEPAIKVKQ